MPHTIVLLLENSEKKRNTCKRRTDKQGKCVRHWNPDTHGGLQGATWQLPQTVRKYYPCTMFKISFWWHFFFPISQFRHFSVKKIKIKSQEKIRTKRFVWEGQHAPRRPETFIFYYSQHLLCTPVVHKSVWVSLEVNSTTVSDMLFVASVLSAYMLYPLCCITFFQVPDFHLQILKLYFEFL